jgi:hypothetical protein
MSIVHRGQRYIVRNETHLARLVRLLLALDALVR